MKKFILPLFAFLTLSTCCLAQNESGYSKGDKLLNVGIGVNSYYNGGIPFGASYEVGITDEISVGANIDYLSNNYNLGGGYDYTFTALYFGGRASYHVNELLDLDNKKVDLYAGATLGYRSFSWTDDYSSTGLGSAYGSGIYAGAFIGGKYYFSNKIGAFAEVGAIGSTNVRIGAAFKF